MKVGETLVGRYELRRSLGSGGRGEVFAARDLRSRRDVAVKVLSSAAGSAEKLDAMASVISAAARMDHPAVVLPRVQLGLTEAPPFVVGELVAGEDLSALVARGPVPWERSLDMALTCADGLIALAEATGVAHRALKPGNVRITQDGDVRVLDFGIAELGVQPVRPRHDESFVEYRAPEQLGGAAGDACSDVFSLGVLLFELVTGVQPYTEGTAYKAAYKIMTQRSAPKPSEFAPMVHLPSQVEALIEHALAREPASRFKDAAELRKHLAVVRRSPGLISRARASATPRPAPSEERTQLLKKPAELEELTTAVNLPLLRSLAKFSPPTPPEPEPSDQGRSSAPEPDLAGPPMLDAGADSPKPKPVSVRAQSDAVALPKLEAEQPSALNAVVAVQSVDRTEVLSQEAMAEKTVPLCIEDRVSRRRALASVAQDAVVTTTTSVHSSSSPPPEEPEGRTPAEAGDDERTTVLVRGLASSPPNVPLLPPASEQTITIDSERPMGRSERERALPRSLVLLNLGCLVLLLLGMYALFAS